MFGVLYNVIIMLTFVNIMLTLCYGTQVLRSIVNLNTIVRMIAADHYLFKNDITTHLESNLGPGRRTTASTRLQEWADNCTNPRATALDPEDAMHFPTHSTSDSNEQKIGRKMRNNVYAKFSHHWTKHYLSWSQVPDEDKTKMADALCEEPLNWHWTVTDKRLRDHIGQ